MAEFNGLGRFIWFDLMTPDAEASKRFYTEVLGWGTRVDRPLMGIDGQPPYTMWTAGKAPIAGIVPFSEAYWLGYVGVEDVRRSAMQARDLGGEILFGPHDIARVGGFAVIADPQGAVIGIFQPVSSSPSPQRSTPAPLAFSWHELAAADWRTALDFYTAMFAWEAIGKEDTRPHIPGVAFGRRGVPYGVLLDKSQEMPGPAWCGYVRVDDVREAARQVARHGGQVISGPVESPAGDWNVHCRDLFGALFALQQTPRPAGQE